ncbi:hypothetical protein BC831DRAFT_480271 [Entophlyctis helioformis]|nr:hypothetical protein BC831DRAFT_480271 [Entophlyctis helioformis]
MSLHLDPPPFSQNSTMSELRGSTAQRVGQATSSGDKGKQGSRLAALPGKGSIGAGATTASGSSAGAGHEKTSSAMSLPAPGAAGNVSATAGNASLASAASGPGSGGASAPGMSVAIKSAEILKFAEDAFDVESYIRGMLLQLPTEEAIQQLSSSLADAKDVAAADLQRNVFRNYNDFVVISKEISKLESDMLYLRGLLAELKDVQDSIRPESSEPIDSILSQAIADDPLASPAQKAAAAAEALAKQRAKEEELVEAREVQMKALYANIEGLQKLLPESKNRHIVRDGSKTRYWEVNSTTFKQKDMVHLYLFSDALVVVSWKKSIITGKARMVAETAWGLSEIGFIDMKDAPDVTNAFKVVKHPDVSIYRTETLEEKRAFLGAIKRITDEILAHKRREKESAKDSSLANAKAKSIVASMNSTSALEDTKKSQIRLATTKDNLSNANYRWLVELPDDLDVLIAHRDFDNAVTNIDKARVILAGIDVETPRVQRLRALVEQRTEALAKLIGFDLASPVATKALVQENIDRLLHLGLGDQARDIFLTARTKTIRHRARQLRFDGDIASYMSDLAEVTFRLIRNTCDWYGGSFQDATMASGFMKWVAGEITHFTDTLRRQVFDSHQAFSVIADCLMSMLNHCQQLRDVGLDLTFLLDQIVFEDIAKAIDSHFSECVEAIERAIAADPFDSLEPRVKFFEERGLSFAHIPRMSESAYHLFTVLTDFAADVGQLMSLTLYNKIVCSLSVLFRVYIEGMKTALSKELSISQYCVVAANITFVIDYMLPKVKTQLVDQFERAIPELENDYTAHKDTLVTTNTKFVTQCISRLIKTDYNFAKVDYTNSASILDTILPTESVLKLVLGLNKLLMDMDKVLDRKAFACRVIEGLFEYMATTTVCWETDKGPRKFGFGGVQTLILDIHFLLRAAEQYITDQANQSANAVCEKALRAYFTQNKDLSVPLKTGEWYDKRVEEAMRKFSRNFQTLNAQQMV